ncbi:hypothetical protein [Floridanema aerugineum]|uniref:Uncharacterized protein n=1 Tax=Floridaenema aerugineum BLCC-F46 TaxID=3153654 RepID=A0ABV4X2M5_9CYAN
MNKVQHQADNLIRHAGEIKEIRQDGDIQLHPEAQNAIASSWRNLTRWLSKTLPLPTKAPNLNHNPYPTRQLIRHFLLKRTENLDAARL